jgi:predicted nucleic acid-binding protein
MIVVDASCVAEVVVGGPDAGPARAAMIADPDHVAPHLVDAEVLGVIRRARLRGEIDLTAATQAVEDLATWPAERVDHRPLLARAWELRDALSAPDALYVALAEALDVPLLTFDRRLARTRAPRCRVVIPAAGRRPDR